MFGKNGNYIWGEPAGYQILFCEASVRLLHISDLCLCFGQGLNALSASVLPVRLFSALEKATCSLRNLVMTVYLLN